MIEEKNSWSETIKSYEESKKKLPWKENENKQIEKISLLERRIKERELNPILMEYRDEKKEKEFKETLTLTIEKKNQERRAKIPSRKYNIVTHSGPPKEKKEYDRINRGTRDYNILSHFNNKFHEIAPLEYDEFFAKECSRKPIILTKESFRSRDFNILSNKYHTNHDLKESYDNEKLHTILSDKYWKTHIYDPIKVQSYDINNEEEYHKQAEKKIQNERKHQEDMFPKCIKYAEGNTYNILSQEITHFDRFQTVQDQTNNRSLNRYKSREVFQNTLQNTTAQLDSLNDERKINRISFQRWEGQIDRGYDPITNSKLSSNSLIPLSKRPMTVWDKVQTSSPAKDIWENDPNIRLNRSHTAIGNKMDVSNNHGLNDDWDSDYHNNKNSHKELQLSKSLSQLHTSEPLTERNSMKMNNSQSVNNLKLSSRENKEKKSIPSLDLSKTSSFSSSNVRTGGLGSFNN